MESKLYDSRYQNALTAVQGNRADTPESPSRIRDAVSGIEERLSEVHQLISMLEKRFDTVLQSVPPSPAQTPPSSNHAACSHIFGRLALLDEGFKQAADRMRDIAQRAEV